ncbi:Na+/H+ antiporter [Nitzschia inconspicua]|uniref:Na+/H+ antiporter n=1 Tax=Nitzschia inconspicua TaxID=303405 RepID=A0A9K3KFH2_9STRA|nr:Na+/H+ antiporter [Nitzschia inconspicua]
MNFLNGTTDANDQCQAFYNAYRTADCAQETHTNILGDDKNSSNVVIDDFFENWECCDYIRNYYGKNCENNSSLHSAQLLGVMLVLLFCTMIKALLKTWSLHWIPDACAFILVGTLVGGILRVLDSNLVPKLTFDSDLFMQIMLPPIIFQAALSIDKRAFRRDLFPILTFAGIGTAFSAIAIGWIVHKVSNLGNNGSNLPLIDSLVFGSLIASIDPVATLSILSGVGVNQADTLYTLIFGESLLNDGVAIVLFEVLRDRLGEENAFGPEAYREMIKHFCKVLFGSMGIGIVVGMCSTFYFWLLKGKQTAVTEVAIFFCWALIPYYIADGLKCSGIISIMVMGFIMDYFVIGGFQNEEVAWNDYVAMRTNEPVIERYQPVERWSLIHQSFSQAFSGRGHLLSRSRNHVGFVAHAIASVMDTAIFAYLGLFLFNGNSWNLRLNLTAICSCVTSRFVMVIVLSLLINIAVFLDFENRVGRCMKGLNPFHRINLAEDDDSIGSGNRMYVDRRTQLILLLAGVRGAVSFALVENIPVWDSVSQSGSKFKAELKAMTSSCIVFTLFVFGALTYMAVMRTSDQLSDDRVAGSNLTHRLLSEPLDSDDEIQTQSELASTPESLEIENGVGSSRARQVLFNQRRGHSGNSGASNEEYNNNPDTQYQHSNEWISS